MASIFDFVSSETYNLKGDEFESDVEDFYIIERENDSDDSDESSESEDNDYTDNTENTENTEKLDNLDNLEHDSIDGEVILFEKSDNPTLNNNLNEGSTDLPKAELSKNKSLMDNIMFVSIFTKNPAIALIDLVDGNGDTPLIWGCKKSDENIVFKLIDAFGDRCNPGHINAAGETALYLACHKADDAIALKLLNAFGEACVINHIVESSQRSILGTACINDSFEKVIDKLLEYGDLCLPGHVNRYRNTALLLACKYNSSRVVIKLIDQFGNKCKPKQINNRGRTALISACYNNLEDGIIKLIDTFGSNCLPDKKDRDGNTAFDLLYTKENKIAINKYLETFEGNMTFKQLQLFLEKYPNIQKYCVKFVISITLKNTMGTDFNFDSTINKMGDTTDLIDDISESVSKKILNRQKTISMKLQCVICYENIKEPLILEPCKHLCLCKECSPKVKECPLCREKIEEIHQIYLV